MKALCVLLLSLLLVSCGSTPADEHMLITAAISQEPVTLDVMRNSSRTGRSIMAGMVFERLLTLTADGSVKGELAEEFTLSDDGCAWTFSLRRDVLFHDGTPLKASDAAASLNRWIDSYSVARDITDGARFIADGEYTLRIESDHSLLLLADILAGSPYAAVIMPEHTLDDVDENGFLTTFIGTGPYKLKEWKSGQYIELEKYADYSPYGNESEEMDGLYGYKHAYADSVIYYIVPDSITRTSGVRAGQYLFDDDTVNDNIAELEKIEGLAVSSGEEDGSVVLIFNKKEGLASEHYIRKAVNQALDLEVLMRARDINGGFVIHPDYMESQQSEWLVETEYSLGDKEGARRILEENGYDGTPLRVLTSNTSNMDRLAVALESELEKAGFNVELIITDWSGMMAYRSDPSRYDIFITAMTQVPLPSLKLYLDPAYPGWSDDEKLSALMEEFTSATTREEAVSLWQEIQTYCYEYLPVIVAGHYKSQSLYSERLEGVIEKNGFYFFNARVN